MQSKTTRGVRHLLVSTGVISLVLSVATPAALADKPVDGPASGNEHAQNEGIGTERVLICHNGRVLEVDDDSVLGGHGNHEDVRIGHPDAPDAALLAACTPPPAGETDGDDEDLLVELCRAGAVVQVPLSELGLGEVGSVPAETGWELVCEAGEDEEDDEAGADVEVCHEGNVLAVAPEALDAHLAHGDAALDAGSAECPATVVDDDPIIEDDDPIVEDDDPIVETPVKTIPPTPTRPVVVISSDAVTKPVVPVVPAAPTAPTSAPAAGPNGTLTSGNEVLGAVTTRIPTGLDASVQTTGGITALAATGAGSTWLLVTVGLTLLLAGLGLQISARRRVRSADITG